MFLSTAPLAAYVIRRHVMALVISTKTKMVRFWNNQMGKYHVFIFYLNIYYFQHWLFHFYFASTLTIHYCRSSTINARVIRQRSTLNSVQRLFYISLLNNKMLLSPSLGGQRWNDTLDGIITWVYSHFRQKLRFSVAHSGFTSR